MCFKFVLLNFLQKKILNSIFFNRIYKIENCPSEGKTGKTVFNPGVKIVKFFAFFRHYPWGINGSFVFDPVGYGAGFYGTL
jgi:hypothetical protein